MDLFALYTFVQFRCQCEALIDVCVAIGVEMEKNEMKTCFGHSPANNWIIVIDCTFCGSY